MSQYTKSTNFATKDNLTPGDPLKIVRGTEIDTEFNNIATAIATKTDNASAALTGGTINDTTIGATTASTGAFTTLAASSAVTFSGGTANGVAYLNGSKVVTSGTALTFDGSNLGLGVTPSAWTGSFKSLQIGSTGRAVYAGGAGYTLIGENWYVSGGSDTYIATGTAQRLYLNGGSYTFQTAASGTAGNPITFTSAMTLDASGNLGVGTTSPASRLSVDATRSDTAGTGWFTYTNVSTTSGKRAMRVDTSNGHWFDYYNGSSWSAQVGIDSSGNLLVGTTSTSQTAGTGLKFITSDATNPYTAQVFASSTSGYTTHHLYSTGAGAYRFYVNGAGTIFATSTTISAISDVRFKENVRDLNVGLTEVMALKPRLYDWKEGKGANIKNARGFIAQEFEEVFPDLIDEWKDPAPEGEAPYKSVRADLIPVLVKAIQELKAEFDAYKASHP